jgi:hypothetical protein
VRILLAIEEYTSKQLDAESRVTIESLDDIARVIGALVRRQRLAETISKHGRRHARTKPSPFRTVWSAA